MVNLSVDDRDRRGAVVVLPDANLCVVLALLKLSTYREGIELFCNKKKTTELLSLTLFCASECTT